MDTHQQNVIEHLVSAIDKVYLSKRHVLFRGFLYGVAYGMGATLGIALLLVLFGVIVHQLGGLPFIGQYLIDINQHIQNR